MPQKSASVHIKDLEQGFQDQLEGILLTTDKYLSKIADFVRDEAKRSSDFADKTGNLRRSIRKRKSKYEHGGFIVSASGRNTTEDGTGNGYHAHLVEYGHEVHSHGKPTGKRAAPHPFLRNAADKAETYASSLTRG